MLPIIPKPGITPRQKAAAVAVAGIADMLQIGLFPLYAVWGAGYFLDDVIDVITAIILTAICGFKWQFVLAFALELVPFLDIVPTWSAVALLLPTTSNDTRVNVSVVQPQNRDIIDTQAISVPPVQAPPVRAESRTL